MLIAIPISKSDSHLLKDFIEVLIKQGGLFDHSIILFHTFSQSEIAMDASHRLSGICPSVKVIAHPNDPQGGWPHAPNVHFHFAAHQIYQSGHIVPWMWLELDAIPVVQGWASKIHMAYGMSGAKFMGNLRDTPHRDEEGNLKYVKDDQLMSGVGVYPSDFVSWSWAIRDLPKIELTNPFDLHMRGEMQSAGWHHTNLIQDLWNTQNYRYEGGEIVCDPAPTEFTQMSKGGIVSKDAVLVHGCKDGSLARLILSGGQPVITYPKAVETLAPEAPSTEDSKYNGKTAKEWHDEYMAFKCHASSPVNFALTTKKSNQEIIDALGGKKKKLSDLEKQTGIPKDDLLKIIESANSGLVVKPGAFKWVCLAQGD